MWRSVRQCVMSASQSSCSDWVQGFEPPSQSPLAVRHSGTGICWFCGLKWESCALQAGAAARIKIARLRNKDFTAHHPDCKFLAGRILKRFKNIVKLFVTGASLVGVVRNRDWACDRERNTFSTAFIELGHIFSPSCYFVEPSSNWNNNENRPKKI